MAILVLNSSPKKENGNTAFFLEYFLNGVHQAGQTSRVVYLYDKKGHFCTGCHKCWHKGACVFGDDFSALAGDLLHYDLIVWASPVYFCGMTATARQFIERLSPYVSPHIEKDGKHSKSKLPPFALFSTCFYNDPEHFRPMLSVFEAMCNFVNTPFLFDICIPAAPFMRDNVKRFTTLTDKLTEAGIQYGAGQNIKGYMTDVLSDNGITNDELLPYHNRIYS